MLDAFASARQEIAPWAVRIAAQAPPLTPEQIATCRAVFRASGCPCGCTSAPGRPDPDCARFRPVRVTVDYSQQYDFHRAGTECSPVPEQASRRIDVFYPFGLSA